MQPFHRLTTVAAPLFWANVNTDDIYPGPTASPVMRQIGRSGVSDRPTMGRNAFAAYRWNDALEPRPEFILNRPPYNQAGMLIARENFGCGSSREMAVWCLHAIGIRCIVAPSFGDIFHNNCFRSGVLPVRLDPAEVERLLHLAADAADPRFTADLETQAITAPDGSNRRFEIGAYHRDMLLQGLDEIEASLSRLPAIEAHEAAYARRRPWLG